MSDTIKLKVAAGKMIREITLQKQGKRYFVSFPFNRALIAAIKQMEGAKWHGFDDPPLKKWSILDSERNWFQLRWLQWRAFPRKFREENPHLNPYARYDTQLQPYEPISGRPLYEHQKEMVAQALERHYCILACEMGTGKTLVAIEASENVDLTDGSEIWYIGPRSGIKAVTLDLQKWNAKTNWEMFTYEGLVSKLKREAEITQPPKMVIFDESSKVKTPTAQRSQAAKHLADAVRDTWGDDGYVIEMTGTPAPKTPLDWWNQCEVACPGFLIEPNQGKMKTRMCHVEMRQSLTGGQYPHIVTWYDDENKCKVCGEYHDGSEDHPFEKSVNEVALLYERMRGLVMVKFAKDCLDLPELRFEKIQLTPSVQTLRAAKAITKNAPRAITGLTLCRELSDGFQYTEEKVGMQECPLCHGDKVIQAMMPEQEYDINNPTPTNTEMGFVESEETCFNCGGTGEVPIYRRSTEAVDSPKDQYLINELDLHEDDGRYIVWGGFTGTIDKIVDLVVQQGWCVLRVDGRGYHAFGPNEYSNIDPDELLIAMDTSHPRYDELRKKYSRICFVGHPRAGGMALTLTASRTSLFYSNDYNGEARMQAVKRGHRAGMLNRAHTIKDLIHLRTDQLILDNLEKKVRMQNITLGELDSYLNEKE